MTQIVCFVGLSASGKTTLAKIFARDWQSEYISLGEIVRGFARSRGYSSGQEFLKQERMETVVDFTLDRLIDFCHGKQRVVVDGVYSPKIVEKLEKFFNKNVMVFNVSASRHARFARYNQKMPEPKISRQETKKKFRFEDLSKVLAGTHVVARLPGTIKIRNIYRMPDLKDRVFWHVRRGFH